MVDTEQPIVRDANDEFKNIFCINQNTQFPSQGPNKVTYGMLMDSIRPFIGDDNLAAFNKDQMQLTENLIFGSTMTTAQVPLRMEDSHPNVNVRGKVYLPCLVAKHTVGDTDKAHTTYFIISFVERFWPHDHPNNPHQVELTLTVAFPQQRLKNCRWLQSTNSPTLANTRTAKLSAGICCSGCRLISA